MESDHERIELHPGLEHRLERELNSKGFKTQMERGGEWVFQTRKGDSTKTDQEVYMRMWEKSIGTEGRNLVNKYAVGEIDVPGQISLKIADRLKEKVLSRQYMSNGTRLRRGDRMRRVMNNEGPEGLLEDYIFSSTEGDPRIRGKFIEKLNTKKLPKEVHFLAETLNTMATRGPLVIPSYLREVLFGSEQYAFQALSTMEELAALPEDAIIIGRVRSSGVSANPEFFYFFGEGKKSLGDNYNSQELINPQYISHKGPFMKSNEVEEINLNPRPRDLAQRNENLGISISIGSDAIYVSLESPKWLYAFQAPNRNQEE